MSNRDANPTSNNHRPEFLVLREDFRFEFMVNVSDTSAMPSKVTGQQLSLRICVLVFVCDMHLDVTLARGQGSFIGGGFHRGEGIAYT